MAEPEVGKLTPTARDVLLNFLKARPNLELPGFVKDLTGTHGFYVGDGAKEREVVLGWKPAFVVFTCPVFPDGVPRPAGSGYWRPELHPQPVTSEKGFKVGEVFNKAGEMSMFVAWKPA